MHRFPPPLDQPRAARHPCAGAGDIVRAATRAAWHRGATDRTTPRGVATRPRARCARRARRHRRRTDIAPAACPPRRRAAVPGDNAHARRCGACARMPDRRGLLRSAFGELGRTACGGAGRLEPRPRSRLPQERLRRRLSGIDAAHRMPVQLYLRRIDEPAIATRRLGPRADRRERGAIGGRLCADRLGHLLSRQLRAALVGGEHGADRKRRRAHLLHLARRDGALAVLPTGVCRDRAGAGRLDRQRDRNRG